MSTFTGKKKFLNFSKFLKFSFQTFRKVFDLKVRLEKVFDLPASKMRLFYVDQTYRDQVGPEEMKYPNKQLYSYNIASGDEIIIEAKETNRRQRNVSSSE